MKKVMRFLLVFCTILMLADMSAAAEEINKPIAVVYNPDYRFPSVLEGEEIAHEFIIANKGKAPLIIEKVKTD